MVIKKERKKECMPEVALESVKGKNPTVQIVTVNSKHRLGWGNGYKFVVYQK